MIGRTISACANAAILADRNWAFMIWGIEDTTKKFVGSSKSLGSLKKGNENILAWLSRLIEPRLNIELSDFDQNGKHFSILRVEPTYDRPVRFCGQEYIRIGESVKPLREFPNHERSIWLATGRRKFEDSIALSHQKTEEIFEKLNTEIYYTRKDEAVPRRQDEIIRKFIHLQFIRDNMENGYDITNLGALLFAKDLLIFPSIANKSVRVIKYSGINKASSTHEKEFTKGYAIDFSDILKLIMDSLPQKEIYVDGVRKTEPVYSKTAIREILANALVHQDFTISGAGPMIEIYQNRIEIINPGSSLIEVDRIIDERKSRNEKFSTSMRDVGLCELRGGGIDKSIIEIEEMGLPTPEWYPSNNSMRVVIFGPKNFSNLSKGEKVWSCFCHCVVKWLCQDYMSNTSLRKRFSLPDEDYQSVSVVISDARKQSRIVPAEKEQGKRNAKYVPYWAR